MDIRRFTGFWAIMMLVFSLQAQQSGISDAEATTYMNKMSLHAIDAATHYFYYMQGVDPLGTSQRLDNSLALAENDLIVLERYAVKHPEYLQRWKKISGYWYNIRNRCVHSPTSKTEQRIFEHLNNMNRLLVEWQNQLKTASNADPLNDFRYRTRFVALLFILKQKYSGSLYAKWLDVELESYKTGIQNLPKILTNRSVKSSEQERFFRILNDYVAALSAPKPDPQKVYELSEEILRRIKSY